MNIDFERPQSATQIFDEWNFRLEQKWLASIRTPHVDLVALDRADPNWRDYSEPRIKRALPDLAFMVGRIILGEDVNVLANLRDQQDQMLTDFKRLTKRPRMRVFISHSREDSDTAVRLKRELDKTEVPSFLDRADMELGEEFFERIKFELPRCSHLVVMVSRAALESPWVPFEVGQAVAHNKMIVPFVVDDTQRIPEYLARFNPASDLKSVVNHLVSKSTSV